MIGAICCAAPTSTHAFAAVAAVVTAAAVFVAAGVGCPLLRLVALMPTLPLLHRVYAAIVLGGVVATATVAP